jgi:cyanate permease
MRNVWATVFATWALFAVLAVLAWTRPQATPAPAQIPTAVVVTGKNGATHLVVVQGGAASSHATTRTSPVPAG